MDAMEQLKGYPVDINRKCRILIYLPDVDPALATILAFVTLLDDFDVTQKAHLAEVFLARSHELSMVDNFLKLLTHLLKL